MSGWSIPMDRFVKHGADKLDQACRKIVLTVYKGVIMDTPVDTGRARGAWTASTGSSPDMEPAGAMAQTFELDKSGRATVAAMQATVGEWVPLSGRAAFLANNLPYIDALNNGHSKQAPKHFVELNVIRAGAIAANVAVGGNGE